MKTVKITPKLLDEYATILNEVDRKIYDLEDQLLNLNNSQRVK